MPINISPTMDAQREIDDMFGLGAIGAALFYSFPGGLRFELSEGDAPLDLAITALLKATPIIEECFEGLERIRVCLRTYLASRFSSRKKLRELVVAGIIIPAEREISLEPIEHDEDFGDEELGVWVRLHFELPKSKIPNLLWCAFSSDFPPLRPNPGCQVYLINTRDRVLIHPYDDRGMDVVGPNRSALERLYLKYQTHLLDYDRAAMDTTFKAANQNIQRMSTAPLM